MKSVILNFDLNDYQTKSDFLETLRSLVKMVNSQSSNNNPLQLEPGKKVYSLTFYLSDDIDEGSTERAVYFLIPSDPNSMKLLVKYMSKGYDMLITDKFLQALQNMEKNKISFETDDGSQIQFEYRSE
jgi:hypothetical protein